MSTLKSFFREVKKIKIFNYYFDDFSFSSRYKDKILFSKYNK